MITLNDMKQILIKDNMVQGTRDGYTTFTTKCKRIEIVVISYDGECFEFDCYYDGLWLEEALYEDDVFSANDIIFDLLYKLYDK